MEYHIIQVELQNKSKKFMYNMLSECMEYHTIQVESQNKSTKQFMHIIGILISKNLYSEKNNITSFIRTLSTIVENFE